jgi:hypothetical protein
MELVEVEGTLSICGELLAGQIKLFVSGKRSRHITVFVRKPDWSKKALYPLRRKSGVRRSNNLGLHHHDHT